MPVPENSISMLGMPGPRGYITMGGMVTILKVREDIEDYEVDPGWYENPEGTEARLAQEEKLRRDGIDIAPAPPEYQEHHHKDHH